MHNRCPGQSNDQALVFTEVMTKTKRIACVIELALDDEPQWVSSIDDPPSIEIQSSLHREKSTIGSIGFSNCVGRRVKEIGGVDRVKVMNQVGFDIASKFHTPSILNERKSFEKVARKLVDVQS